MLHFCSEYTFHHPQYLIKEDALEGFQVFIGTEIEKKNPELM